MSGEDPFAEVAGNSPQGSPSDPFVSYSVDADSRRRKKFLLIIASAIGLVVALFLVNVVVQNFINKPSEPSATPISSVSASPVVTPAPEPSYSAEPLPTESAPESGSEAGVRGEGGSVQGRVSSGEDESVSVAVAAGATAVGALDPHFRTCGDAIYSGYGPYRAGIDPEYDWYRDRDGDGMVCER